MPKLIIFFILSVLAISTVVFAADGPPIPNFEQLGASIQTGESFGQDMEYYMTLADDDPATAILSELFGQIGEVIPGIPGMKHPVGEMFFAFNVGVWAVAVVWGLFIFFRGTIATAHEGQFLGQSYHTVWCRCERSSAWAVLSHFPE